MNKNTCCPYPPLGWNSWDCYGPAVNEEQLLGNARYMEEHLKQYGWDYVVCDIQWSEPKAGTSGWDYRAFAPLCLDDYGRQIPAENRFPSAANGVGFKTIADQIHAMGLKFGIHIMRGVPRLAVHQQLPILDSEFTCDQIAHNASICKWNSDMYGVDASKPGAQQYYNSLFQLYASWGVDFVKVDDICNTNLYPQDPYSAEKEIELIRHAIDVCGRDMVLSLSPGPAVIEKAWHMSENANMWRITDDFWDDWGLLKAMFERCEVWQSHVTEGCYPDCDMLPVGVIRVTVDGVGQMTRFTHDEQLTMMNLWSIFRSPLIIGGELRKNDNFTLSLLTNPRLMRLNQHSYGARQLFRNDEAAGWKSMDEDGSGYLALFNLSDETKTLAVPRIAPFDDASTAQDIWSTASTNYGDLKTVTLRPHASVLYRITK